jgi:hypothetical protein
MTQDNSKTVEKGNAGEDIARQKIAELENIHPILDILKIALQEQSEDVYRPYFLNPDFETFVKGLSDETKIRTLLLPNNARSYGNFFTKHKDFLSFAEVVGMPDFICKKDDKVFFVEVKSYTTNRQYKGLTPKQAKKRNEIKQAGFEYRIMQVKLNNNEAVYTKSRGVIKKISVEEKQAIKQDYANGLTYEAMAEKYNYSNSTIWRIVKK